MLSANNAIILSFHPQQKNLETSSLLTLKSPSYIKSKSIYVSLDVLSFPSQQQAGKSKKKRQTLPSLPSLMATAIVSKPTLSKWFSNKSFMLSVHRFHHSKSDITSPSKDGSCPPVSTTTPAKEQARKDELQGIFGHFDADGNGKISGSELRSYLASIGEFMSPEEAQAVTNDLDAAGGDDLMLDFDDFVKLMEREGGEDDLKRAFEMFVVEKGSGSITPEGLRRIFSCLGYKLSAEECKTIIQAFDQDGDGVLGFPEFQKMMA
ncbi:probable calcium-binding protein CML41 [Macadamia integrifolia]|uniref:probable calcium-binding protein CML41 n=1 Tax=Macadamia integrifolia TaxID=60698 RepID=UPI001C4E4233|nr:probable calcium-binding protein CML41 [Macadamia integrifolia]